MRDDDYLDPAELAQTSEREEAIAEIVGDYLQRRERHHLVRVDDLVARAEVFGPVAVSALRFVIRFAEDATTTGPGHTAA